MHFTSHKALIKSPGEHDVTMETSQQRAGLRHKHERNTQQDLNVAVLLLLDGAEPNIINLNLNLRGIR